jgi:hypothetical protein
MIPHEEMTDSGQTPCLALHDGSAVPLTAVVDAGTTATSPGSVNNPCSISLLF